MYKDYGKLVLPEHKGSCILEHNMHLDYDESVKDFMEGVEDSKWCSIESKKYAIEKNELWAVSYYIDNVVRFKPVYAGRWEDLQEYIQTN